jgi:tRNA threonylcarbamoyladenosine biosynthesis protein TsaE
VREIEQTAQSEDETGRLAQRLAASVQPTDLIALIGPLGAGKTAFARAFIHHLVGKAEEVPSPTFTLVQTYDAAAGPIWHFDLYRLREADEIWELGFEDALSGIVLIEWADRLGSLLPTNRTEIRIQPGENEHARIIRLLDFGASDLLRRVGLTT